MFGYPSCVLDGQGTKWRKKIAENFNWLSRVHEHYRLTTDGRATAYSEREREFTFARNRWLFVAEMKISEMGKRKTCSQKK